MYIPKRYGQSRVDTCPFCGHQATTVNRQKVSVCNSHRERSLGNLKCACGSYLELKTGKFGPFFTCMNCGCVSMKRALDINQAAIKDGEGKKAEITIRSDDPTYFEY